MTRVAEPRIAGTRTGDDPRAGAIADARRRQLRRRAAVAALAILVLAAFALTGGTHSPAARSLASASSPRPLSGTPLTGPTHVRLLVGGAGAATGGVRLVDADSGSVRPVAMPGGAPLVAWLEPFGDAALASVGCAGCTGPAALYVVGYDGSVRARAGAGARSQVLPVAGSGASWTLSAAGARPCMLRRDSAHAVEAPCGRLVSATASNVVIAENAAELLVDLNGAILASAAQVVPLAGGRVLEATAPDLVSGRSRLTIVDLATGVRHAIPWPATPAGYQLGSLVAAPGGRRVAIELFDAVTHPAFAADLWVLTISGTPHGGGHAGEPGTAALTHIPGFPVLEGIKQSSVAWTADGALLIPSDYHGRNVLGSWSPGSTALRIRRLPALATYYDAVALTPR